MVKEKAGPPRPLRVALTITEMNVGGAERCVTNLALGLDPRRYEPVVVSLGPRPLPERAALVEQIEAAGIPIHFLNLRSPRQALTGINRLRRLYGEVQPDVVQTFLFHANVVGVIAARRAGVPAVATGVRVADPRRIRLWTERLTSRHADRVVCVSQAVADFVAQRGGIPLAKIRVIPNGIDVTRFETAKPIDLEKLGIPSGRRVVTVVGRLERQKGLDWLLSLAPRILEQAPRNDLLLVGAGPQRAALERTAEANGIGNRTYFAGYQSDIPSILAASDLLLLPSRWEGMPNIVLEAMAAGLPVVSTQCEGVCELLGDAGSAQTAPFGDSQAFVTKAVAFLNGESLRRMLGNRNQERVRRDFTLAVMVERYARLFDEMLASRR